MHVDLPCNWVRCSTDINSETLTLSKIMPSRPSKGSVVTHTVTVNSDNSWMLHVLGKKLNISKYHSLKPFWPIAGDVKLLLDAINKLHVCPGHPDDSFVVMLKDREGKGLNAVVLDDSSNVIVDGQTYNVTIRHVNCDILTDNVKCSPCTVYRSTLRALYSRYIKQKRSIQTSPRSHVNLRYLRTPEKWKRFNSLKARAKAATRKVNLLLEKVKGMSANDGVQLDEQLDQDIVAIMDECREHVESNYSPDSFERLFWEEQKKARQLKSSKQMRWHPMLIKWCLKMKLMSSAAYSAFRSSGLLMLPSERTLRDYTHWMKAKPGFQIEVDRQLIEEAKLDTIPDYKKYVCIVFDEVKVKEGWFMIRRSVILLDLLIWTASITTWKLMSNLYLVPNQSWLLTLWFSW